MPFRLVLAAVLALLASMSSAQTDQRNLGVTSASAGNRVTSASAGNRVALVIGNAAYPGAAALKNPANDATDIAAKLNRLGFDVTVRTDMPYRDMLRALTDFGDKVQQGTEALFFYAGHGMQVRGKNYLIPIDAQIRTEGSVSSEAVDVDQLLDKLAPARLSMVILDACRNNPFERRFRGSGQGLASINAPTGTLIAYATAPGKVAADGDGRNGLYTQELLNAMDVPGIKVEDVFKRVRGNVVRKSGDTQTPWESSSLTGDFFFNPGAGTQVAQLSPGIGSGRTAAQIEDELWDAIKGSEKASVFEEYLKQYPNGRYLAQAKVKLAGLKDAPAVTAAPAVSNDPETQFWLETKSNGTKEYYNAYLRLYPTGKFVRLANQELKKLEEIDTAKKAREEAERLAAAQRKQEELQKAEQQAWEKASAENTLDAYTRYLATYPQGRSAVQAEASRMKLQAIADEREKLAAEQRRNEAEKQRIAAGIVAERQRIEAEKAMEGLKPGQTFRDCADCPEMVVIPAGSFEMGSNENFTGNADWDKRYKPVHTVRIGKAFALAKTELTRGQFAAFVSASGYDAGSSCSIWTGSKWEDTAGRNWRNPGFSQSEADPVTCVNWGDAQAYVRWLSQKSGKSYRLPSEAEWEYACRAGGTHTYCGSESVDSVAWYGRKDGDKTKPVAGKQANAWGLYDMSGNVWEWTQDCYNETYSRAPMDGTAWSTGNCGRRVIRGGSWIGTPQDARADSRGWFDTTYRSGSFGFRLARMLP